MVFNGPDQVATPGILDSQSFTFDCFHGQSNRFQQSD